MKNNRTAKSVLAGAFGLPNAPVLVSRTLHKSTMTVTEVKSDQYNFGITESMPYDDAYLIALQIRDCEDHDLYFDDKLLRPTNFTAGVTTIYDLKRDPIADLRTPFHSLHFYLPRKVLNHVTDECGSPRIGELTYKPAVGIEDPICRCLLSSLRPAMDKPDAASSLFIDHVALAISNHVAKTYGGMRLSNNSQSRGGLSPWQERRAKEVLREHLDGNLPLAQLAAECGLSVRHFARAFRQSTGVPPHRWLLTFRVEQAKRMLLKSTLSLPEIATACGFADQSHFTRVFTSIMGVSPGLWRRSHR